MDETLINNLNYSRTSTQNPSYLGAAAYQRLSLSNPASAHGSPDRSMINSGMFSPPVTRRPPIAPRTGPLSIYNGGYAGQSSFGPGSLPTSSGSFYYGHRTDDVLGSSPAASRRANLSRMRQHRSLEGDNVPYFSADPSAGQSYFDNIPPADPQVQQTPFAQRYQISPRYSSQGNLGGGLGGGSFSTAGSYAYGGIGGSNLYGGTSGSGAGGGGGSMYQSGMTAGGGGQSGMMSGGGGGGQMHSGFGSGVGAGQFQSNLTNLGQSFQGNVGNVSGAYQSGTSGHGGQYHQSSSYGQSHNLSGSGLFSNPMQSGMNPGPSSSGLPMDGSSSFMASQPLSISTNTMGAGTTTFYNPFANRDPYNMPMPLLQREYELIKREYESSMQKLNSSMNSIKTFWSPELKKERAMRKEEASKLALMQEQLKMASQENQKQAAHMRQLQDELQCQYELSRTIRDTEIQSVPREEYEAVRLERDRLHRELHLAKDTLRELEVQIETQRQTLGARDDSVKKLLDMLQSKGLIPYSAAQDRLELEQNRTRIIDLENRCKHMETMVLQKDQDVHALRDECLSASQKLRQMQMQFDRYQRLPVDEREATALQALLDTKVQRIEQLEQRIALYEDEIAKYREQRMSTPRNFTDKSVTDREYQELKLKAEKLQLELNQRQSEYQAMQTRLSTSEEQTNDFKKHLELMKESSTSKDHQVAQFQSDVEALRAKLETRTETIDHKTQQIQSIQQDKNRLQSEIVDVNEQLKIRESKMASLQRKMESYEEMLKEKDHQLEMMKQRLASSPSMIQQKQFQEQLDELMRERDRLLQQLRDQRDRIESERIEELDAHRREVRDLRIAIESLQKEITDRQMLIESQNEKISDLNRDLVVAKLDSKRLLERGVGGDDFHMRELDRLTKDLQEARNEVDRLLKIIQSIEKEKENLNMQIKDLEKQVDDTKAKFTNVQQMSTLERKKTYESIEESKKRGLDLQNVLNQKDQRVEELEEALKESVSITAERELAIAQQKQMTQQLESKMGQYKDQMSKVQRQYDELNNKLCALQQDKQDKDTLIRGLKHERKKHLEEVMQLKEESLVAAISEKDAHIALLETTNMKNPDEIETLRKHKEKLLKKLKEENVRRMKLFNEQNDAGDFASLPLMKDLKSSPADQIIQIIRYVELQRKKLRVFIDQLLSCMLDVDPHLLSGIARPQLSECIEIKLLKKLTQEQLLLELKQRENDSLQMQHYANMLLQRFSQVRPTLVRQAVKLLDSFNGSSTSTSYQPEQQSYPSKENVCSKLYNRSHLEKRLLQPHKVYATTSSLYHKRLKPHINAVPRRALSVPAVDKTGSEIGIEC